MLGHSSWLLESSAGLGSVLFTLLSRRKLCLLAKFAFGIGMSVKI